MCFENRCGCHRRRRCTFFNCFCRRRRRCGCFDEEFGCERFERFDSGCDFSTREKIDRGENIRELGRPDFEGFFPEARFERIERGCGCRR